MELNKINRKRLARKVLEDGIKKSLELGILAFVIGIPLDKLILALGAVIGGSLYRESDKIDFAWLGERENDTWKNFSGG